MGPTSEFDMTDTESTTKKIEVATSPIKLGKGKGKKDKNKEHVEIRENDDFSLNEWTEVRRKNKKMSRTNDNVVTEDRTCLLYTSRCV